MCISGQRPRKANAGFIKTQAVPCVRQVTPVATRQRCKANALATLHRSRPAQASIGFTRSLLRRLMPLQRGHRAYFPVPFEQAIMWPYLLARSAHDVGREPIDAPEFEKR